MFGTWSSPGCWPRAWRRRPWRRRLRRRMSRPKSCPTRRVAFRIYAPKATTVTVRGDWMEGPAHAGAREERRGPVGRHDRSAAADFYSYTFTVDGVRTLDPRNALIKQGLTSVDNMFFVPGAGGGVRGTPPTCRTATSGRSGIARPRSAASGACTSTRLPATTAAKDRYPVLYLLHGGGDDDSGWSTIGRAGFIVDNLLASGKVRPLIVVMPNGSLPRPANFPITAPGAAPSPQAVAASAALQDRFVSELMNDVVPFVERQFRVDRTARPARDRRVCRWAAARRSACWRPIRSRLATSAIWSAGVNPATTAAFEERSGALLKNPAKVNAAAKVLSLVVGDKDFTLAGHEEPGRHPDAPRHHAHPAASPAAATRGSTGAGTCATTCRCCSSKAKCRVPGAACRVRCWVPGTPCRVRCWVPGAPCQVRC